MSITHKIYSPFEEIPSKETRAVFLDLSKAFYRGLHGELLYKLKCSGVSGDLLILFRNFLTYRQRVVLNGKCSPWATVSAGVPQGSISGPLFFLVYINDIVDNIHCDIRLFTDDTSIFSVVRNDRSSEELNKDLERLPLWSWQLKMYSTADKPEEVIFSIKRNVPYHDPLKLGNDEIDRKTEHKRIEKVLDSQLSFQCHIREAILKARRGIGIIRYISKYVSRNVLDQVYKLYVRPHLDCGDIIYHRYDPDMRLNVTK